MKTCFELFGYEMDDGWKPFVKEAVEKIVKLGRKVDKDFQILQVKEKFGGLRIYTSPDIDEVETIIEEAEKKAKITCERCGKEGSLQAKDRWLKTVCDKCFEIWTKEQLKGFNGLDQPEKGSPNQETT